MRPVLSDIRQMLVECIVGSPTKGSGISSEKAPMAGYFRLGDRTTR